MVDEQPNSVPKGKKSKNGIIFGAVTVVVVVIVLIAVLMMPGSSKSNDLIKGDPSGIVLSASDLGPGWNTRGNYTNQTDNYQLPGAVASGFISFNKTNETGGLMYIVTIQLLLFQSITDAQAGYDNTTAQMMNMTLGYLGQKNITVGNGGHIGDVNRSMTGHDGKFLIVLEKNVMFAVDYDLMSADAPKVTEGMAIDIANRQISKL